MQESPIQIGKPIELHAMSKLYNVNSLHLESRIESWNIFSYKLYNLNLKSNKIRCSNYVFLPLQ